MDAIIHDVQSLHDVALSSLRSQIMDKLKEEDLPNNVVDFVEDIFSQAPEIFCGLQTQHQQLSYFKANFNFVVSL